MIKLQAYDIRLGKNESVKQTRTNYGGSKSTIFYVAQNIQPNLKQLLFVPVYREINHVHVPPPDFLTIHFNIILKSTPKNSDWSHSSIFSHQNTKHLSKEIP
jgi:hypothetical protein